MQTTATHTAAISAKLRRQLERQLWEAAETLAERHEELGRRIKLARDQKGWKQKQLAAAVHVEPVTVSRWERGAHAPDVATLKRIAAALDKPTSYFVTSPEPSDEPSIVEQLARLAERQLAMESSLEDALQLLRTLVQERDESGRA